MNPTLRRHLKLLRTSTSSDADIHALELYARHLESSGNEAHAVLVRYGAANARQRSAVAKRHGPLLETARGRAASAVRTFLLPYVKAPQYLEIFYDRQQRLTIKVIRQKALQSPRAMLNLDTAIKQSGIPHHTTEHPRAWNKVPRYNYRFPLFSLPALLLFLTDYHTTQSTS